MRYIFSAVFVSVLLGLAGPSRYACAAQNDAKLKALQSNIATLQAQKAAKEKRRTELFSLLQQQENDIASLAKALNFTQISIKANQSEQQALTLEGQRIAAEIMQQREALAAQMRSAYVAGNNDLTKMLFNQEVAGELERMLTYYQYFYAQRKSNIDHFQNLIASLAENQAQLEVKQTKLKTLAARQSQQSAALAAEQLERQALLNELTAAIKDDEAKLNQLKEDEERLLAAIAKAKAALKRQNDDVILAGLSNLRGQLLVPASGQLKRLFGQRRQGQLRWKGIIFNGNTGEPIKSIHTGKVLYAGWLRGFGLVLVIDHGAGYMSVYGHNQALLKEPGDIVQRGETIALMGQSGGQNRPNLYFELRKKGIPVNPTAWLDL